MDSKEGVEALARLKANPNWGFVLKALKQRRDETVKRLLHASAESEYERGILAGRACVVDELLELAEAAPQMAKTYGSQ